MRRDPFEFSVKGIVTGESGLLRVVGRGGDLPIRVGDIFDRVYRNQPRKSPEESGRRPIRGPEKLISLRVVCVHAYERSLPELGEGMTGSLQLEGSGATEVEPGSILGREINGASPSGKASGLAGRTIVE